ncbi:GNAT family N-acetyltransferase [Novosphingobium album (ex Hu et al. 2023)]|uniref:GNAT family N-acetyltransferase n=1 Tax=Novosphingobium album (ex Hu et al. 2023) TaxID=2930093 RepID=A0ABT0B7U6_9SPHN|nr:GNAT family N-acetyltransferase [Novosphingobium album (ex Hu et al. 2023)]MCJ2180933.1 GNAT family N-acetyltransferase [Novosphingobium album (ex Hu et al. 2023)]
MIDSELTLDTLTADDLPQAVALSSALGWPYRLIDWQFAHGLGHGLALRHEGRLIGTALWWDYGATIATVGMIIVDEACRGRKLGSRLVDALIEQTQGRSIILNATLDGVELYRRRGFAGFDTTCQHQGPAQPDMSAPDSANVAAARKADLPSLAEIDRQATGMDRTGLLSRLCETGNIFTLRDGTGQLCGYAVCREFGRGHVIGPVIAPDVSGAQALISVPLRQFSGQFVRVDTAASTGLSPWLAAQGLAQVDTVEAMVRGDRPQTSPNRHVFALCSQSLG